MAKTILLGDKAYEPYPTIVVGAVMSTSQSFVRINGIPIATTLPTDLITPHSHPLEYIASSPQSIMKINGSNVAVDMSVGNLGAIIEATGFVEII